jgi:hypothetical protein
LELQLFIPYTFPAERQFVNVTKRRSSFLTLNFCNVDAVRGTGAINRAPLLATHEQSTRTLSGFDELR